MPDDFRQDINHLNRWGAEIFSKELAARIQKLRLAGTFFFASEFFLRKRSDTQPRRTRNFACSI